MAPGDPLWRLDYRFGISRYTYARNKDRMNNTVTMNVTIPPFTKKLNFDGNFSPPIVLDRKSIDVILLFYLPCGNSSKLASTVGYFSLLPILRCLTNNHSLFPLNLRISTSHFVLTTNILFFFSLFFSLLWPRFPSVKHLDEIRNGKEREKNGC